MTRKHLGCRESWQAAAAERGGKPEKVFDLIVHHYLIDSPIAGVENPKEPREIYGDEHSRHGIAPDCVFRHRDINRSVFIEIKQQWVKGNAHERACKFVMPGILNSTRRIGNQPPGLIPVWWIFADVVASDFRDRREILHWLQGIDSHVLLWENMKDYRPVVDHFEKHIQPFLS